MARISVALRISLAMAAIAWTGRAEILDRVAVTVGKHVITENDVILDLRVSAFLDQKPVLLSGEQKRKAADRLVDQYLILQEASASRLTLPIAADAQKLIDDVKKQYASDADYRAALARYGVTEDQVASHLLAGLRELRFTDLRFRPEIQLSDDELHEFYDTLMKDQKKTSTGKIPSFEESYEQVEKLLTDQRVMQSLDRWLGTTRTETQILYQDAVFK